MAHISMKFTKKKTPKQYVTILEFDKSRTVQQVKFAEG